MVTSTLLVLTACGSMGDLAKGLPGGDLIAAGAKAKEFAQVEAQLKGYEANLAEVEKSKGGEGLMDGFKNPLDEMKEAQTEIDLALAAEKAAAEAVEAQ